MSLRWAAFIAAVCWPCGPASAQEPRVLTLETAFTRTLEKHPELARYSHLREAARAEHDAEIQGAPIRVELDLENGPRTDQDSAFYSSELTLSLASAFERSGKREARGAVADAQFSALALQEEQRRVDLLAEVARRYLDFVTTQALADLMATDVTQRERVVEATARRMRAGASPESVHLSAEAALARATMQRDRLRGETYAAALRLAILWSSRTPDFDRGAGNPLVVPATPSLDSLRVLIESSPELRRFADESRLREARVQLARTATSADIEWRAGIRRLEEDGSWAAVAGIAVPLGSGSRAQPRIRAAQSELAALTLEREAEQLTLEATLIEAHTRLSGATAAVITARDVLIPKFEQAERASERAFRAGALTYLEWAQVQSDVMAVRSEQLLAAVDAHRALIEIQRLTGSSFTATPAASSRTLP
jgi:cobalt-zinc-cadmium efflux system outer membrane protein